MIFINIFFKSLITIKRVSKIHVSGIDADFTVCGTRSTSKIIDILLLKGFTSHFHKVHS